MDLKSKIILVYGPTASGKSQFAVKLALGEFADSLFDSSRIVPGVALSHGFQFQFADIQSALKNAITT